ncbi:PREDICTED: uncharacterized protein LOC104772313 [Camelina sativa]|uniref:Uncharacterized protein LOC104772313 n=1 Tax=Camelina sativa TaxID=90675 RepID=A0ABM0Y4B7_CAMSA|nr:PREDICTED: uncharacterized protein LOC104772313 [Camelina sativa]
MDPWVEDGEMRPPWIKNTIIDINLQVKDLIDFERRDWDIQKLEFHFLPIDIARILKSKPVVDKEDIFVLKHNKSGDFSVKSAYWVADTQFNHELHQEANIQPSINDLKAQVWKLHSDPKLKVFLSKILSGALPVISKLKNRGIRLEDRCQLCGQLDETINHVLFQCFGARQVWALSDYPSPEFGYDKGSVFSNLHHLLINRDNKHWPSQLRKSFPWIIWRIWKNRNSFLFENKFFSPPDSVIKIRDEVEEWFIAQRLDINGELSQESTIVPVHHTTQVRSEPEALSRRNDIWKPPPLSRVKCNVGVSWSRRNQLVGGAWVLRDERGKVLLHSRRAFTNVECKDKANFLVTKWAIECILSLRYVNVTIALEAASLICYLLRPKAWPSFNYESIELLRLLEWVDRWKVEVEGSGTNRGAFLIAQSVTSECRLHSYVAAGAPSWLHSVFEHERVLSSA